jgi:hypothetical protein
VVGCSILSPHPSYTNHLPASSHNFLSLTPCTTSSCDLPFLYYLHPMPVTCIFHMDGCCSPIVPFFHTDARPLLQPGLYWRLIMDGSCLSTNVAHIDSSSPLSCNQYSIDPPPMQILTHYVSHSPFSPNY